MLDPHAQKKLKTEVLRLCAAAECSPQQLIAMLSDNGKSYLYQSAPLNALLEGVYEGNVNVGQLKTHGDFGIGTFDGLDGEMVVLDGHFYQIDANGQVREVDDSEQTPFACVTFFQPILPEPIINCPSYAQLQKMLAAILLSPNMLYGLRIDGVFASIHTRSVPKSENFVPLVQITRNQPEFHYTNVRGSIAGFYVPDFLGGVNVPGFHLHFLSEDRSMGGHLLDCSISDAQLVFHYPQRLEMDFPVTLDYLTLDFSRDARQDIAEAE